VTASRRSRRSPVLLALPLLGLACAGAAPPPPPVAAALEPLAARGAYVPDDVDRAARDVAAAALAGDAERARRAAERIERFDAERADARERGGEDVLSQGAAPTGLAPIALDLVAATRGDERAYRARAAELLERDDLEPALRARLQQTVDDDPLRLADARMHDATVQEWGQAFNAVAEPVGTSITRGPLGAVELARSLLGLAVARHVQDDMSVPERQALTQWKRFVAEHPDAPEAEEIRARIAEAQAEWNRNERDRALRRAREALREDRAAAALVAAERALDFVPEDRDATELRDEAQARLRARRADRARSLEASPALRTNDLAEQRRLALALWKPGADVRGTAEGIAGQAGETPIGDEARFVLAPFEPEDAMWASWDALAGEDASPMARHSRALVANPERNPYAAFRQGLGSDRAARVGWVLFGPLASGPRRMDLPRPVEWMIDAPSYLSIVTTFPNRLVRYPWLAPWPFGRVPAQHARTYLERYPDGVHAPEVRGWLTEFEAERGNWAGALALTDPAAVEPARLAELRENAARQSLEAVRRERRRDTRAALARELARSFHDTTAGREAGELAREESENASPQRIRISRGFLAENPRLRGPEALGLRAELVDGSARNGELHPEGVYLLGGRVIELCFLGEGGDEEAKPRCERKVVSAERLARVVTLLDETSQRNALVDPDDPLAPDARRERFFEQARLGVADAYDPRATAMSSYEYVGVRERYGLVRGRESLLPVDIVVQGSFPDFGLGAFPRIRMPKPTPDAALYR